MRSIAVVIAMALLSAPVRADDPNSARAHYQRGTTLFDLGKYIEAAHEYEEAFAAKNEPALLFNMGQAYRLGGDYASALRSYRAYLRRSPNAANRADVEDHIANLQKLVDEQKHASNSPPTGTMQPGSIPPSSGATTTPGAVATPVPGAALTTTVPAQPEQPPLYKRWWLWTAVAAVVIVGVAVGVTATPHNASAPPGTIPVNFP
jgi:tetratricopeptide (TPR) repeat protein